MTTDTGRHALVVGAATIVPSPALYALAHAHGGRLTIRPFDLTDEAGIIALHSTD